MAAAPVDANIILRYLTNAPLDQAERAARLFAAVAAGQATILVEDVVVAEVVWTLTSYCRKAKGEISRILLELLADPGVQSPDKPALQLALAWFHEKNIYFVDALLAARTLASGTGEVYSFDRDFDRIPGLTRREPG